MKQKKLIYNFDSKITCVNIKKQNINSKSVNSNNNVVSNSNGIDSDTNNTSLYTVAISDD